METVIERNGNEKRGGFTFHQAYLLSAEIKLNSCNYTCSYCPFGKKSHLTATTQDEQAWNRLLRLLNNMGRTVAVIYYSLR